MLLVGSLLGACGGPSQADHGDSGSCSASGTASLTGTLLGDTFVPKDAVFYRFGTSSDIVMTDFADTCAIAGSSNLKANSNVLLLHILQGTLQTGTLPIGSSTVDAQFANFDSTCNSPKGESAGGGSVTITAVDGCGVTGTFDLTLNSDHVTGSFRAAACAPSGGDAGMTCK
jgi:hypothetical protein